MHVRRPILTFLLAIAAVALHSVPDIVTTLEFDRAALAQGQVWRWTTAHLTHFDANHLLWDVTALLALV